MIFLIVHGYQRLELSCEISNGKPKYGNFERNPETTGVLQLGSFVIHAKYGPSYVRLMPLR